VANHKSAIKRIRQNLKRNERNRYVRSTMRTYIRRVREAVAAGDAGKAGEALCLAIKTIDKAASKGVIHKNQASRRISRLQKLVNGAG
jgi:small subunit ribosomal protein S20